MRFGVRRLSHKPLLPLALLCALTPGCPSGAHSPGPTIDVAGPTLSLDMGTPTHEFDVFVCVDGWAGSDYVGMTRLAMDFNVTVAETGSADVVATLEVDTESDVQTLVQQGAVTAVDSVYVGLDGSDLCSEPAHLRLQLTPAEAGVEVQVGATASLDFSVDLDEDELEVRFEAAP